MSGISGTGLYAGHCGNPVGTRNHGPRQMLGTCDLDELSPNSLVLLVHSDMAFRKALFATHAKRLPTFFAKISAKDGLSLDNRLADWLLCHAKGREVVATHGDIAKDLLTAREVVSRRLREFATKGWIIQQRGRIHIDAPAALTRLSRECFSLAT